MTWSYLNPTAMQQWAWTSAYRCPFCGSDPSREDSANGRCYCRDCESCTMHWKADVVASMDEGRPRKELCPECLPERETCEHCGREIATAEDGEMQATDPRVATLCWSDEGQAKFCDKDPKRPGAPHRRDCRCDYCYVDQDVDR